MSLKNKNTVTDFNFNHRVSLQKEVQKTGDYGEIISSFEEIAQVWADIVPKKTTQNFSTMKHNVDITHEIEIRYREDAKDSKKIIFGKREFDVLSAYCENEEYEILIFEVKEKL